MPTEREIQFWTAQVGQYLPEADVLGVIREGNGLLLLVRDTSAVQASDLDRFQRQLLRAGASGWNWAVSNEGLRIRVQWPLTSRWPVKVVLAVLTLTAFIYYDVHSPQAARSWFSAWQ